MHENVSRAGANKMIDTIVCIYKRMDRWTGGQFDGPDQTEHGTNVERRTQRTMNMRYAVE